MASVPTTASGFAALSARPSSQPKRPTGRIRVGRVENGSEQRRGADERLHEEQEDSPEEADDGSGGESRQSLT
jgi:hypothetical protein